MHVHFLDPYLERQSPLHQLDSRVKLVLTLAFILTTALIPHGVWPAYILLLALALSVEIVSELGVGYVLKRSLLALPFVLAAFPLIFTVRGTTIFEATILSWRLVASLEGLERFASIAVKSWISVQAAIVLASSTPFPELLAAMRAVGVPRLLVAIFGLMWRYLFVLADEALRLMRARLARSSVSEIPGARAGRTVIFRARVTGGMAGNLFLRAFERSDRIYMAMLARGYDGEVRCLPRANVHYVHNWVLAFGLSLLASILALSYLFSR